MRRTGVFGHGGSDPQRGSPVRNLKLYGLVSTFDDSSAQMLPEDSGLDGIFGKPGLLCPFEEGGVWSRGRWRAGVLEGA